MERPCSSCAPKRECTTQTSLVPSLWRPSQTAITCPILTHVLFPKGESDFFRSMIEKYDSVAQKSGT
eukprot:3861682-Rhodomonas_salina.1